MRSAKEQDIISNSKHCINAMTSHVFGSLYQFRVIVGRKTSSHSIISETLYKFWDIVLISGHSNYFETLYLFRDFVLISRFCIYIETSIQDIIFISRKRIYLGFPQPLKRSKNKKNKNFHILKNGLDIVYLLVEPPQKQKQKKNRKRFFCIYLTLKNRLDSVCSSEISMDVKAKQASE